MRSCLFRGLDTKQKTRHEEKKAAKEKGIGGGDAGAAVLQISRPRSPFFSFPSPPGGEKKLKAQAAKSPINPLSPLDQQRQRHAAAAAATICSTLEKECRCAHRAPPS